MSHVLYIQGHTEEQETEMEWKLEMEWWLCGSCSLHSEAGLHCPQHFCVYFVYYLGGKY